jgi:fatty acid desaturase
MKYREQHLDHHRHFGDPLRDPDFTVYSGFPLSRTAFLGWLLSNFLGVGAFARFKEIRVAAGGKPVARGVGRAVSVAVVQFVIFASLWALFETPLAYLLWIGPLITVAKGLSGLRTFCEHGSPDGKPVLRTFVAPLYRVRVLGSIGFDRHAEHHCYPTVPFSSLSDVRRLHAIAEKYEDGRPLPHLYEIWYGGHIGLFLSWMWAAKWRSAPTKVLG